MVHKIYKYLKEEHATNLLENGEILFRNLSYFRDYEDNQTQRVIGDRHEGHRRYSLKSDDIREVKSGNILTLPQRDSHWSLDTKIKQDKIFVFCTSTVYSENCARTFETNSCIEFFNLPEFYRRLRALLPTKPNGSSADLVNGCVKYYNHEQPLRWDWTPERVVLSKLQHFSEQKEYRIAFSLTDAFELHSSQFVITTSPVSTIRKPEEHRDYLLKFGNLQDICHLVPMPEIPAFAGMTKRRITPPPSSAPR